MIKIVSAVSKILQGSIMVKPFEEESIEKSYYQVNVLMKQIESAKKIDEYLYI